MKRFEIGKTYSMRSPGMHDCIWSFTVVSRTPKTVTLRDNDSGEKKTCRINGPMTQYNGAETVLPLGHYSMCPVLDAAKTA